MTNDKRVKMLKAPFNYERPGRRVSVVRDTGPMMLEREIADAAIAAGYAIPFDPAATAQRKTRSQRKTLRPSYHSVASDEADKPGQSDRVDGEDMASPDLPGDGKPANPAG